MCCSNYSGNNKFMGDDTMKTRIGTDIIEVYRIEKALKNQKLLGKIYTENEIRYCDNKRNKYQHYAVRFAGKEAVYKAISPFLKSKNKISWKNIEIENDKYGRPKVNLIGIEITGLEIDISLSHIEELAIATAIVTIK